jgi:LPXTG-motif cell wall-anchored protein
MPFMSLTRRLTAGLPAVGVTVLAALALSGSPAAATGDESAARARQPAVMATPCSEVQRGEKCDYGYGDDKTPDNNGASPDDNGASPDDNGASPDDNGTGPTRGNGGYGSESPTPAPSTPSASVDTVPPGGELPATSPAPAGSAPTGVSAGGNLPLTGAPMGLTAALGGLMVAAGAAAVLYTRRRRNA